MTPLLRATTVDLAATPTNAWPSILELGRLAPTPHNTQWYFVHVIDDQTALVCIDESIAIPFTDPNDQFRYTGLGVFARHLELAASAAGFELQTTFDELDRTGPVVARIVGSSWSKTSTASAVPAHRRRALPSSPSFCSPRRGERCASVSDVRPRSAHRSPRDSARPDPATARTVTSTSAGTRTDPPSRP